MTLHLFSSLHRAWLWITRSKHNGGHGIHSPFIFRMIEFVTSRHLSYYNLEALLATTSLTPQQRRSATLLYRVTAYLQPSSIKSLGAASNTELLYARSALSGQSLQGTLFIAYEGSDLTFAPQPKDIIIVTNTFYNKQQRQLAHQLIRKTNPRTIIDFTDLIVLLFDPALHAQHYLLNP